MIASTATAASTDRTWPATLRSPVLPMWPVYLLPMRRVQAVTDLPGLDQTYVARSELLPLMVLPAANTKKPRRSAEAPGVYDVGCAGAIPPLHTGDPVPLELVIPKLVDRRHLPETWRRRS